MNPFKLTGILEVDRVIHDKDKDASPAALFMLALANGRGKPTELATEALRQLSVELLVLADGFAGGQLADLQPDILQRHIHGLADRAQVAAEVAERIEAANRGGGRAVEAAE
jgi:hypothetical protein